jgi:hypothetical protein
MTTEAITEFEIVSKNDALSALEDHLLREDAGGLEIREMNPEEAILRSTDWNSILISIGSAASLKIFKDSLAAFLAYRRCKLTITVKGRGSITFEGPVKDKQEVLDAVRQIASE